MIYNFDEIINRRTSDSIKWNLFDEDVIPLWVADMDFVSPKSVIDILADRVQHGVFGYGLPPRELTETICKRLLDLYNWKVELEEVVYLPGVVVGFNNVIHALTGPDQKVLIQTPVYNPFLYAAKNAKAICTDVPLIKDEKNHYFIDFDEFESKVDKQTALFLFCNPHNPVGRVYTVEELSRISEIYLKHNIPICSDEIHCDLIFHGHQHVPIASLGPEIAKNSITLMSPSKTFNIAGLGSSFAIVQNPRYRKLLERAQQGLVSHVNILGSQAALAAYTEGSDWLKQLMQYLTKNRDFLENYVNENFPGVKISKIEGTYLAWLDFNALNLPENPYDFFLKKAKVALTDGEIFGSGGKGFVRLNFGCQKSVLLDALDRMNVALSEL